jgi:hypothetical protein
MYIYIYIYIYIKKSRFPLSWLLHIRQSPMLPEPIIKKRLVIGLTTYIIQFDISVLAIVASHQSLCQYHKNPIQCI